ncbi:selenocysteine-specific translation elongation factor [Desulfotomaculum copahuensis]|uniref:Selenocysteine-specific elongation factor n=1 Tax=Desulfotomaculum copahuensis TaxID=1838280 RepID=A0A1B7LH15_9FIRM|nr:selenocysteine-specific translation elongation factor [Desulfotomaculum copahuensis]OAT85494.1 selenocysteine-specific translation elongation factor [Desulfotomaculum copahuensis]
MNHLIIGTAGHVDHGKTMLVKALTGVDTDRLKEEKDRGISIELGFASLKLPGGRLAGIVDVPGHERFIKNMLAGAGGMDLVLLVIAADEGVMPQTREHMDIIQLLQINRGVVVLTKVDLVDEEWLAMVRDDVKSFLQGTVLENAPLVEVSAATGQGIGELLRVIDEQAGRVMERPAAGRVRLPVDRAFSVTGFGTVVTGTLWSGELHLGDTMELMPRGLTTRVRSLQVHGKKVDTARAGQRVAANLTGLEVEQVSRGSVLAAPGSLTPSYRLDVRLLLLKSAAKALKNRARIRLYLGTAETLGRVILLDREEMAPGETALAQLELEEVAVAQRGDRFVIRSYSPMRTIGGGAVIDPVPHKHKRLREEVLNGLATRERGTPAELVEQQLPDRPALPTGDEIAAAAGLTAEEAGTALNRLIEEGRAVRIPAETSDYYAARDAYARWAKELQATLSAYHRGHPLRDGYPREELRSRQFPGLNSKQLQFLLQCMEKDGLVQLNAQSVARSGFTPHLEPALQKTSDQLEKTFRDAGFQPPAWTGEARRAGLDADQARELLAYLLRRGILIKVADDLYFHRADLERAKELLLAHLAAKGNITVGEARDLWQTTRKYALPLLEYFDRERITRRVGDNRVAGRAQ